MLSPREHFVLSKHRMDVNKQRLAALRFAESAAAPARSRNVLARALGFCLSGSLVSLRRVIAMLGGLRAKRAPSARVL